VVLAPFWEHDVREIESGKRYKVVVFKGKKQSPKIGNTFTNVLAISPILAQRKLHHFRVNVWSLFGDLTT
jgi:hypothetical protein